MKDEFDNLKQELDLIRRDIRMIESILSLVLGLVIFAIWHFW